jgi:hypothetical protein
MVAVVHYPNLSFDQMQVDFGCVLNDTQKRVSVVATNTSTVPVAYRWLFVDEQVGAPPGDMTMSPLNSTMASQASDLTGTPMLPPLLVTPAAAMAEGAPRVEHVFDVLPIHGVIQPGPCLFPLSSLSLSVSQWLFDSC